MGEIQHLPTGQNRDRARRAASIGGPMRFMAANDNRAPKNARLRWLALAIVLTAAAVVAAKLGLL